MADLWADGQAMTLDAALTLALEQAGDRGVYKFFIYSRTQKERGIIARKQEVL